MNTHGCGTARARRVAFRRALVFIIALEVAAGLAGSPGLLPTGAPRAVTAQEVRYQAKITNRNLVGLTLTNYGFFGNNFSSRSPSFEYPLGEGFEHMSRAGLWIGALAVSDTGEAYRVSHAVVDNAQGSNQVSETEFTPLPGTIVERSRLLTSKFYDPAAVSDQDFVAQFTDRPARSAVGANGEDHEPLDVDLRLETYGFGLEAARDFVVLHFEITNRGRPLRDAYVGLYTQLVSGDKNAYPGWPPSGSAPAGSWYYKKVMTWVDSLSMVAEHFCRSVNADGEPDPESCDYAAVPPWVGSKFLGVRAGSLLPEPESLQVNVRFWNYEPSDSTRDQDVERYALMARRGADDPSPLWAGKGPDLSPIEFITVGPFPILPPDSTLVVDFALVGGATLEDLSTHAAFAQFAFDQEYRLPAPPPSPHLRVRALDGGLELLWDAVPERVVDDTSPLPGGLDFQGYRVYAGRDRNALPVVAQFDIEDTSGFNTGFAAVRLAEPIVDGGDTLVYGYTVRGLKDGFSYFAAVTSFDTGDAQIRSLESGFNENKTLTVPNPAPGERAGVTVYPNPYKVEAAWDAGSLVRDHYLWFANLPERANIRIYTLSGDLVFETDFDGATYSGANARGLYDPSVDLDVQEPALSGASFAWNLISREGQAIASGLYLFAVETRDSGEVERGKDLVVKADRESFR